MHNWGYRIRIIISAIIFILCILGILGIFYPFKILNIEFAAVLQRLFIDFSITAMILAISIILLTIVAGRFYCSTLCPLGFLQEVFALILKKDNEPVKNYPFKYFITAIVFGITAGGSAVIIKYIEPFTLFSSALTGSITSIIIISAILAIVFFKNRLFCTNICPVGTILGLLSKFSINKIYVSEEECLGCRLCERVCPSGAININDSKVDNETCLKCLKCLKVCPKQAIKFGINKKSDSKNFSLKRRSLIIAASAVVLFGGMIKAGTILKDKITRKIKNILLPPGAVSSERFANKCCNCNSCINNCPKNIIVKADKDYPAVHLDYSKGYCEKDCNKCSEVCPTGAIKKISLEEKQKTRIGIAVINEQECLNCDLCHCVAACPYKAIIKEPNKLPVIDAEKCVGCGRCTLFCHAGAVNIFAVKNQNII